MVVLYQRLVPLLTSLHHAVVWGLPLPGLPGLDERDGAFMERLRNLAHEALTWPHLNGQHRLMWATVLELDVVPVQDTEVSGAEKDTRMLRFKRSNATKRAARSTSEVSLLGDS